MTQPDLNKEYNKYVTKIGKAISDAVCKRLDEQGIINTAITNVNLQVIIHTNEDNINEKETIEQVCKDVYTLLNRLL